MGTRKVKTRRVKNLQVMDKEKKTQSEQHGEEREISVKYTRNLIHVRVRERSEGKGGTFERQRESPREEERERKRFGVRKTGSKKADAVFFQMRTHE